MKKIKLGYIGSGPISNFHIPALRRNNFKVLSLFSRQNSTRISDFSKKFKLPKPSLNLKDFITKSKEVDCFVIAIKTEFTQSLLKKIMSLNKPILVEKPGAIYSKDLKILKKNKNKKLFFAYNRRFYYSVSQALKFVNNHNYTLTNVKIPDSINTWHQFRINGCHVIDLLFFLFGDLKLLNVYSTKNKNKNGIMFSARSKKDHLISVLLNWGSPDNFEISINADKKKFELKPIEIGKYYENLKIIQPTKKIPLRMYTPETKFTFSPKRNFNIKPGFSEQYKEFYDYIKGKKIKKLCTLNQAIRVLEFIEKIIKLAKK